VLRHSWLFALLFIALASSSPAQQVDASNTGGSTQLDAPWRLHFGDDPAFAQPGFDDSQWTLHRIDKDWASAGHKGHAGYAWYRMRVILPKRAEPLALAVYHPVSAVEVYIDGTLAGTIGHMSPKPAWTHLRSVYAIAVPAALHGRSVEVALRVWESPKAAPWADAGAAAHPPLLGTAGDVERIVDLGQQDRWIAEIPDWAVDMLGLAVGLFSLGLFLLQRQAREYAYAAVFLCGFAAAHLTVWIFHQNEARVTISALTQFATGSVLLCMWLLFTWRFIRARADRLLYACLAAAWIPTIGTSLVALGVIHVAVQSWAGAAMNLFLGIAVFARLYTLARRGNRDAQLFLIPFSLWALDNCFMSIIWALGTSGKAWYLDSGWVVLYHGSRFDITWSNVLVLLLNLTVGAVLVLRYARSAEQEQRLLTEMESARRVQGQLVPTDLPQFAAFACDAVYRAAGEVGGDFYQVFPRPDGSALILVGDVSGKGLRAAMLGTLIVGAAGALAQVNLAPAEMLDRLNRHLHGRNDGGFATCLCALLTADGMLSIANAGHLTPYHNGRELSCESGLPLGILPTADYTETCVHLDAGDALTFMSDGVVEARNAAGELFGFDRTRDISEHSAEQIADAAARFGQEDDITVLTVRLSAIEVAV
jgi:hypothetical protein